MINCLQRSCVAVVMLLHAAVLLTLLGGCEATSQSRLLIDVQPQDANVTVERVPGSKGASVQRKGGAWFTSVSFDQGRAKYRITATRSGFAPTTRTIAVGDYARLPAVEGDPKLRRLTLSMREQRLITFEVNAANASIQLTSPAGQNFDLRSGQSVGFPAVLGLQPYVVVVEAPGYETRTLQFQPKQIADAINQNNGVIRISISSDKFVCTRQLLAGVQAGSLVVRERQLRGWIEDESTRERTLVIAQLQGDLAVRGVTIDSRGRHIVYSLLENSDSLGDGDQVQKATLHSLAVVRGSRAIELPATGLVDIDPYFASDRAQTLLFSTNSQTMLKTYDLVASARAAPQRLQLVLQGSESVAAVGGSMSAAGVIAVIGRHADRASAQLHFAKDNAIAISTAAVLVENAAEVCVSPDGSKVAYVSSTTGDIFLCNASGSDVRQVTRNAAVISNDLAQILPRVHPDARQPFADINWSPDSRYIVYSGAVGIDAGGARNFDVWIAPANGGNPVQVTTNGSADLMPVWSGDNLSLIHI